MRDQKGLTLVELLVTLAILAILVSVAFPGFQGMMARNNIATTANSMILAVNLARSEAVRGTEVVRVIPIDPSDNANEYGPGWDVVLDAGPTLIRRFPAVPAPLTMNVTHAAVNLSFNSRGGIFDGSAFYNVDLCNPGVGGVRVRVAATGRPSSSDLTAAQCP